MSQTTRASLPMAPIACTLTPASGASQTEAWPTFHAQHPPRILRTPESLILRYPSTRNLRGRLEALVETERRCCSFVEWSISERDSAVEVTIAGGAEALDTLGFLAPRA